MKYAHFLALAIIGILALTFVFLACSGDWEEDQRKQDWHTQQEADDDVVGDEAKYNESADLDCSVDDVVVHDCQDACVCCYPLQEENKANCVDRCSNTLVRPFTVEHSPVDADYDAFNKCVLGCVSLCGERERNRQCWYECMDHLGL